jgi:hypothetical protein
MLGKISETMSLQIERRATANIPGMQNRERGMSSLQVVTHFAPDLKQKSRFRRPSLLTMKTSFTNAKVAPAKAQAPATKTKSDGNSAEHIILKTLAQFRVRGVDAPETKKVAAATKLKPKTFMNVRAKLKQKNHIECDRNTIRLTDLGIKELGPMADRGGSTEEVHNRIKDNLRGKSLTMFEALADGTEHDLDNIAVKLGYHDNKAKAFRNLLGKMKTAGIVNYDRDNVVLNPETCFPFGGP